MAPQGLPAVPSLLARLDRFEIDPAIRATTAAAVRSLDAIHLGHCSSRRLRYTIDRASYLFHSAQRYRRRTGGDHRRARQGVMKPSGPLTWWNRRFDGQTKIRRGSRDDNPYGNVRDLRVAGS